MYGDATMYRNMENRMSAVFLGATVETASPTEETETGSPTASQVCSLIRLLESNCWNLPVSQGMESSHSAPHAAHQALTVSQPGTMASYGAFIQVL